MTGWTFSIAYLPVVPNHSAGFAREAVEGESVLDGAADGDDFLGIGTSVATE